MSETVNGFVAVCPSGRIIMTGTVPRGGTSPTGPLQMPTRHPRFHLRRDQRVAVGSPPGHPRGEVGEVAVRQGNLKGVKLVLVVA